MEIRIRATGQTMFEEEFREYQRSNGGPTWEQTTAEILDFLEADVVFEGPQASGGTVYQYSMRNGVEQKSDGKWYTKYVLGPVFVDTRNTTAAEQEAQYKAQKDNEQAEVIRKQRNQYLQNSDWTQVADAPVKKNAWTVYRQALRDVTTQTGFPWNTVWPTEPQ
jgi:hypothetical protein